MKEDQKFIAVPPSNEPDFIRVNFNKQDRRGASYPKQPGRYLSDREAYGLIHIFSDSAERQRQIIAVGAATASPKPDGAQEVYGWGSLTSEVVRS